MDGEAGAVGEELPAGTALVGPVFTVYLLVLDEVISACAGFPTPAALKKSIPPEAPLVLNERVCVASGFLAVSPGVVTFSIVKGRPTPVTGVWFLPCASGLLMGKSRAEQKALPNLLASKRLP